MSAADYPKTSAKRKVASSTSIMTPASPKEVFAHSLDSALIKWRKSIEFVETDVKVINLKLETIIPGYTVLPDATIDALMEINLKQLKISGWDINPAYNIVQRLRESKATQLEVLHFSFDQHITFSQLMVIAEGFSALQYLRCKLSLPEDKDKLTFPVKAMSHGLRQLVIVNTPTPKVYILPSIARYLNCLFPHLDEIVIIPGPTDKDKENWDLLRSLVKLCQDVRQDDASHEDQDNVEKVKRQAI